MQKTLRTCQDRSGTPSATT